MNTEVSRGRPRDLNKQDEQKQKLILAARSLMCEKSYKSITIRELGAKAGVNSAMIRYYFESKEGLIVATINDMSTQQSAQLETIVDSPEPIKCFIQILFDMFNTNKGLARFIHDEVLNATSPLRSVFIASFPKRIASFLPALIENEMKKRNINTGVNPKFAAFNLMCMIVMPFIGAPVRQEAWGISDAELSDPKWVDQLYHQFINGCMQGEGNA